MNWQFWIDVGGTFTDCIGVAPDGRWLQHKTLSSGIVQGQVQPGSDVTGIIDAARARDPAGFWTGAAMTILSAEGTPVASGTLAATQTDSRRLLLKQPGLLAPEPANSTLPTHLKPQSLIGARYQLDCGISAPVLAIRMMMQLSRNEVVPAVRVRFGTTRGTNTLLTRTGAKTVLITTPGFEDAALIGNQARPDLFALNIVKREPLFSRVLSVAERIDANGTILHELSDGKIDNRGIPDHLVPAELTHASDQALDLDSLRRRLTELRGEGFESVAICLMNSCHNDAHEKSIERIARDAGFTEVSRSSEVSPLIRFVPRCDTTTLDAYLNPVLRKYLDQLRHELPGSEIQVMTSAGGLVSSHKFRGRDSILSGPAAGIVGFSKVAADAGFKRAIGFDMGGTSTDVARFDGHFEYQNETTKAGVRIMTPVLAIETIAAGGGSICGFDGVRLFVGPHSAGADPGPACYGSGGPLTITDLNVFLGRIRPEHFPLRLDIDVVRHRLSSLREDMLQANAATAEMSLSVLAEGLIRIADDNMVRAIRRVSVAQGYDPADYVLVSFGGAGGQHACGVARSLKIRQVLLHPFAGILSAYGAGQADISARRQHGVWQLLNQQSLKALQPTIAELIEATRQEVIEQGIQPSLIQPTSCRFDLRYSGTDSGILVEPTAADQTPISDPEISEQLLHDEFERQHRHLYGYVHSNRPIEIVSLQVETNGHNDHTGTSKTSLHTYAETAATTASGRLSHQPTDQPTEKITEVWFGGQSHSARIFLRDGLSVGTEFKGPAIVCEPTSTIFVEPGCTARVISSGAILINIPEKSVATAENTDQVPDAVLLEVFSNQFASIAEQMGEMLRRTSVSTNVRERLDFSCALFDSDGQLVVNAPHVPVHLGAMGETVRAVMKDHPDMRPGDVFITNDPYRGGSHLPDVTVVTPVFISDTDSETVRPDTQHDVSTPDSMVRPAFFTANRAHHAEIGGIVPGSMPPFSESLAEEGVLIRSQRLVDAGQSRESAIRDLLTSGPFPTRAVRDNLSDLTAQTAANACGARLLKQLAQQHSVSRVTQFMKQLQTAASRRMRQALRKLQNGQFAFQDHLDDGTLIQVRIIVQEDKAIIDFSGSGGVHPGNLNANSAITTATVLYTLRCLLREDVPLNAGVLEPITLIIPEGILNPARGLTPEATPAIVGGNVETSQRIVDVLFGALHLAAASQGTMNNLTFGNDQFGYYETICGGAGATSEADGADAVHTHMTNTRLTDPEILEQRYPVRLRKFCIRAGSGGAGLHRGGDGIVREIEFLQPVTLSILSQRRTVEPYGMNGGQAGQCGRNLLRHSGESEFCDLGGSFTGAVEPGTILRIETPGGGAWGELPAP